MILVIYPNNEGFFLEVNHWKKKWIACCFHDPRNYYISSHMDCVSKVVEFLCHNYENFLITGVFEAQAAGYSAKDFCNNYSFIHLVNEPTSYKYPVNP